MGGRPMPGPMPRSKVSGTPGSPSVGLNPKQYNSGPATATSSAPAPGPAQQMPYGQANDPAAYGTPGAAASSPLGMWQSWLNSMGPMLAQMPNSQPQAESGGLSSLAPSPTNLGTAGYYGAGVGPQFGDRGFRMLALQ